MAESDAIAEAVLAGGAAKLPIQPDVLSFGMRVKAKGLQVYTNRKSGRSSLHASRIVRQGVVLPCGHQTGLKSRICQREKETSGQSGRKEKAVNDSTKLERK